MKPKEIFRYLEISIGLSGPPEKLVNAIEKALFSHFKLSAIRSAELAEARQHAVAALIEKKQLECEEAGRIATVCLLGAAGDIVAGTCHILHTDSSTVSSAKKNRLNTEDLLSCIQKLSFQKFEIFGAKILKELGSVDATVTPHSNDQGIDFFGNFNFGSNYDAPPEFFRLAHDVQIRFAGQAKHYPDSSLGTSIVRELVGSIHLARLRIYSSDKDPFETMNLRPLSPVVALLFTSGTFTRGARELAAKSGLVLKDGQQLATFLADRGVGVDLTPGGNIFNPISFDKWLAK